MELKNIGIALSGGGIRATIFHLGLFKWLAERGALEEIKRISSVSGASLCVGLIYSYNNLRWPTSEEFFTTVLPSVEKILQTRNLQLAALSNLVISPSYLNKKVNIVAKSLEHTWGVHGSISDLTGNAMWYINCTTYETGKRFRFCRENMGDYIIGYVKKPKMPLSEVMAASAGFPILIGPYSLSTSDYQWTPYKSCISNWHPPSNQTLHLWDGGVYDNLGLESIFNPDNGGTLKDGLDFMIISNASPPISSYHRKFGFSPQNLKRMLDISMDQVSALRSRTVMDFINRTNQGMYIKIGNSAEMITSKSRCPEDLKRHLINDCLSVELASKAMHYPTTLWKPSEDDYQLILRHGYEVADCTYRCYHVGNIDAK